MNKYQNNLLEFYRNYLYTLQENREYGDKYGDTDEMIKLYEEELAKYKIKRIGSMDYKKDRK